MTVAAMTCVDVALLQSEFCVPHTDELRADIGSCPSCASIAPHHAPGCAHDQALGERGYPTYSDREAARARLRVAGEATIPPPPVTERAP